MQRAITQGRQQALNLAPPAYEVRRVAFGDAGQRLLHNIGARRRHCRALRVRIKDLALLRGTIKYRQRPAGIALLFADFQYRQPRLRQRLIDRAARRNCFVEDLGQLRGDVVGYRSRPADGHRNLFADQRLTDAIHRGNRRRFAGLTAADEGQLHAAPAEQTLAHLDR